MGEANPQDNSDAKRALTRNALVSLFGVDREVR